MDSYQKIRERCRQWLLSVLPPCREAVVLVSQSMERPLSLRERMMLKLHLWVCAWCTRYMEQLHTMRKIMRNQSVDSGAPGLPEEARERLKRALTNPK